MPVPGVAPVRARSVVVTAAASRIPAPPREAGVTTRILVPPRLPDATETRTPAAAPVPAAMVMAEAATTAPIRPEATAATTMADAMVAADFMRLRSADRMARPTQRAFIVVLGESRGANVFVPEGLNDSRQVRTAWNLFKNGPVPAGRAENVCESLRSAVPTGTVSLLEHVPGTSYLATIMQSLRDAVRHAPYASCDHRQS